VGAVMLALGLPFGGGACGDENPANAHSDDAGSADGPPRLDAPAADVAASDGSGPRGEAGAPSGDVVPAASLLGGMTPFSIVLLPDTQFYTQSYPDMFEAQTRWIVAERERRRLAFVLHEGDIVETPTADLHWTRANNALSMMDNVIPYVLCAGNHDIIVQTREAPIMNARFPLSRFAPHLAGTFRADKIQNAFYLLPGGGKTWLVLSLEFGPGNDVLTWADGVLKQRADLPAILLTHAYMYRGDQRYDHIKYPSPKQYWNPHDYGLPGSINDGEEMWQKLVSGNENLMFVFSGHATHEPGAAGLISTRRPSGRWIHEMLANYQGCPSDFMCVHLDTRKPVRGGEGFLRTVTFDPERKRALVETYSPYLDAMGQPARKTDPDNQFELPLD
jgi:hypothetical protein